MFPKRQLRRYRYNPNFRSILNTVSIQARDFIYPIFVVEGNKIATEIKELPGVFHFSLDQILEECEKCIYLGLKNFLLFPVTEVAHKNPLGSYALDSKGLVQRTIEHLKKKFGNNIFLTVDLCLCSYTNYGHCGIFNSTTGDIDNQKTLEVMKKQALSYAQAGADMIAPSSMMDGIVLNIREILDSHGYERIPILSYSVKYASSLYTAFRKVVNSNSIEDRNSYQLSPSSFPEQAFLEAQEDVNECADILMIKPSLFYLDIIYQIKQKFNLPIACYQVSGEYLMIKLMAEKFKSDEKSIILESLISIKRSGADFIISYFAKEIFLHYNDYFK